MNIGDRIKQQRLFLGLTVEEVASKLNKNKATIYRYESSDIENFSVAIIEPLAKILETSPAYLMGWTDDNKFSISSQEEKLFDNYNKMNTLGKDRLVETSDDMISNPKYTDGGCASKKNA